MGVFSQKSKKVTNIRSQNLQGIDMAGPGILSLGDDSTQTLNVYDVDGSRGPSIVLQSGSPGASARTEFPTVGGLTWHVWAIIVGAAVFLFWNLKRH